MKRYTLSNPETFDEMTEARIFQWPSGMYTLEVFNGRMILYCKRYVSYRGAKIGFGQIKGSGAEWKTVK